MAQIFASERSTAQAKAPAKKQEIRDSAPENALAGLLSRADASSATARLTQMQNMERAPAQRMEEEEMMQGKFADAPAQRMEEDELQGKFKQSPAQRAEASPLQAKENNTEMPDDLKSGIESLSGQAMDDVKVHRNSPAPAQMNAHAYAQGTDIHLASGQEKHLPHEAWHVAQQKQGRVQPTTEVSGTPVNDNAGLESEADVMGAKAAQMFSKDTDR